MNEICDITTTYISDTKYVRRDIYNNRVFDRVLY